MKDLLNDVNFRSGIDMNDMPEIDLYMDQVIQLFESKLSDIKRNEDEKILTKTMINNYAKGKLLLPIKNKKYSKEHLILMALIYNLKGLLSINDIKSSLDTILDEFNEKGDYPLRELYGHILEEENKDINEFKSSVNKKINEIENCIANSNNIEGQFEKKFLLLCSLINMGNMYRRLSEKVIDEFFIDKKGE